MSENVFVCAIAGEVNFGVDKWFKCGTLIWIGCLVKMNEAWLVERVNENRSKCM